MKYLFYISVFLLSGMNILAQKNTAKRSVVFKVRATTTACSVFPEDTIFWIEKTNNIRIKVRDKNRKIRVAFSSGKIVAQDSTNYTIAFDEIGTTVLSIYDVTDKKAKLIFTESYQVSGPLIYFCGVKMSTKGYSFKMREKHLDAKSLPLKTDINVTAFDMIYFDGLKNNTFHAAGNMLTAEMQKIIFEDFKFRTQKRTDGLPNKSLYFANIKADMPDGTSKFLSPFAIDLGRDSSNTEKIAFQFILSKVQIK